LNYKANLTMPKLVIDATGDEFFMPDDDHYWWGELPGETLRMMIQNAEHTMATGVIELITGLEAWYAAILTNSPRPSFTWEIENGSGNINMDVNTGVLTPHQVVLRFATTTGPERRDFRLIKGNTPSDPCKFIPVPVFGSACLNPIIWVGEDVAPTSTSTDANGDVVQHYVLSQPLPPSGWRAFMAELYFTGPMDTTFQLTTQVSIIPQTFPFPPCNGTACYGTLV
jgi:PhoPQ-activated pathogenicity-related protein